MIIIIRKSNALVIIAGGGGGYLHTTGRSAAYNSSYMFLAIFCPK